jgi:glycosyltransferase involved in cell wall biosynthesis
MIVMATCVRNEARMVGEFVRHNLAIGFDHVILTDNGSDDGTKDIVEDLARDLPVTVRHQDGAFDQDAFTDAMVRDAVHRLGARWVACFDVDEMIIVPQGRSLSDHLAAAGDRRVLILERTNVFPSREVAEIWDWRRDPGLRGTCPFGQPDGLSDPAVPMPYPFFSYRLPGKVLFRPEGLVKVSLGGHSVVLDPPDLGAPSQLQLWHYPWRGLRHIEEAIMRRRPRIMATPNSGMSGKYRRWHMMLEAGQGLDAVIAEILPARQEVDGLIAAGVVLPVTPPEGATWAKGP